MPTITRFLIRIFWLLQGLYPNGYSNALARIAMFHRDEESKAPVSNTKIYAVTYHKLHLNFVIGRKDAVYLITNKLIVFLIFVFRPYGETELFGSGGGNNTINILAKITKTFSNTHHQLQKQEKELSSAKVSPPTATANHVELIR